MMNVKSIKAENIKEGNKGSLAIKTFEIKRKEGLEYGR